MCSLVLALSSQAQEPSTNEGSKTEVELIVEAEAALQPGFVRNRLDLARKALRQFESILQRNPTTPYRQQVEEDIRQVQESLAAHQLQVASFYMSRGHAIKGAQSRLLEITQTYPQFSQMDEVLLRLGTLAIQDERPDDAATYLWKLMCRYPNSSNRGLAFEKLAEVGFCSWQGCDSLKQ